MGDSGITVTPTIRYELRSRTPTTPNNATPTKGRSLRSSQKSSCSSPTVEVLKERSTPLRSCNSPRNTPLRSCNSPKNTPLRSCNTPTNTPRRVFDTPNGNMPMRAFETPNDTPSRAWDTPTMQGTTATPTSGRALRSSTTNNTPNNNSTPSGFNTPSANTPSTNSPAFTPSTTPATKPNTPATTPATRPTTPASNGQLFRSNSMKNQMVFKTPMSFKPRLVGNKIVPSPSRAEIWKQELGLADDPGCNSDKENTSSDEEGGQSRYPPPVEYRALEKQFAEKSAQHDEDLLKMKNYKDKIRLLKSRLEREETTKRQQLKILRKSHEVQIHEKEALIDNLQSIVTELEDRLREIEESAATTPRKRKQLTSSPTESANKLIEDIKRLQSEKLSLASQLNEVQLELNSVREETQPLKPGTTVPSSDNNKWGGPPDDSSHNHNNVCNHCILPASCTTDTEKQVEVLQGENERLAHELTEARNSHTKASTVLKLNNHRQQQLEEEVSRLKQKVEGLDGELGRSREQCGDRERLYEQVSSLEVENMRLQGRVEEIQAEYFSIQAKSPEVVKETRVKEVESERLRKRYEEKKTEIEQLKTALAAQRDELHTANTQIKYLEKMVELAQTEKAASDSQLWKELESQNTEHQNQEQDLRQRLETDKQDALKQIESRLKADHKQELQDLGKTLETKHQTEVAQIKQTVETLNTKHKDNLLNLEQTNSERLAKIQHECAEQLKVLEKAKTSELSKLEKEKHRLVSELEQNIVNLKKKHEVGLRELEEDLTIAKAAAVTKVREELQKEKARCLGALEEKLVREHEEYMTEVKEHHNRDLEAAVEAEKARSRARLADLETRFEGLVRQLTLLRPVLTALVESYVALQREVARFPKVIEKTVASVKKEVSEAITSISEHNKILVVKYQKEMRLRKKYHNELVELKGNIRVFCRVRPLIKEDGAGLQAEDVVSCDADDDGMLHINCKGRPQSFEVDRVFDNTSTQETVYNEVKALVTSCIDGFNVCIFAYGQTGSGKTYTMEGTKGDPGINQRALYQLFDETRERDQDWEYTVTVSVLEIYNEMIRDLLSDDTSYKMEVKMNPEGGYHIPGLSFYTVTSVEDVNECFKIGKSNRATAATNMNEHSSRSHALLCVTVTGMNTLTGVKTTGKLNLVDLAGSERVSKSKSDGTRLKEAQSINKSLASLGDVIFALRAKQSFVPYRNSKLTYLLQDSLGGDSKTLMITQVSPVRKNEGETICSLNFAQRVRNVELGAATRKLENGDLVESLPCSPARTAAGTPQRGIIGGMKPGTPSSGTKLTPISRQARKK